MGSTIAPFLLRMAMPSIMLLIYRAHDFGGILLFCNALGIFTNHVLDVRAQRREAIAGIFPILFLRLCRLLFFLALNINEGPLLARGILKAAVRTRSFHVSMGLTHPGRRLSAHIASVLYLIMGVTTASGAPGWEAARILTVAKYLCQIRFVLKIIRKENKKYREGEEVIFAQVYLRCH